MKKSLLFGEKLDNIVSFYDVFISTRDGVAQRYVVQPLVEVCNGLIKPMHGFV